jgi:hypothetical protein
MGRDEEFLGWVAASMGDERELAWWDIPLWLGESKLRVARVLTAVVLTGAVLGPWTATADPRAFGWLAGGMTVFAGVLSGKFIGPGRLRRAQPPLAMVPRRPRSAGEAAVLAMAVLTGIPIRGVLRRQWIVPVTVADTPDSSYRACRRSTAVDLASCVYTAVPLALLGLIAVPGLLDWAGMLCLIMVLISLDDGKVFPVRFAELVLMVRWRRPVSVHRTLERAVRQGTLRCDGPLYEFADRAGRRRLAVAWGQTVVARSTRIPDAVAAASADGRAGARRWLLRQISRKSAKRICWDIAIGLAIAPLTRMLAGGQITGENIAGSAAGLALGGVAIAVMFAVLSRLKAAVSWSLWRFPDVSTRATVTALAAASLVADLLVLLAGPGPARHGIGAFGITVLPAALVAVTGGWLSVVAYDRWHEAKSLVFRHIWDALAVAVTCVAALVLAGRWPLSIHAAAGVLLPAAVWLSIRVWRAMNDSDRPAVRACADLTVSVLVGGSLAITLIWLADLLNMPLPEVTALRAVVTDVALIVDIPWWGWLAVYALLVGATLAFALRPAWLKRAGLGPDRLAAISRRFARLRVGPATEVIRRVTSGAHIGLLMVLLIGLTGQVAVAPVLRARLDDRYALTLADQDQAREELAAYLQIPPEFTGPPSQQSLAPLAGLVATIEQVGNVPTELDLARRLGVLEAATVATPPEPAETAGPAPAGDRDEQLGELDTEEKHDDDVKEQVDQAAELAASAVAQALRIPRIGDAAIVQIIREYLSGLIEFSPLKDVLADHVVVPDPDKLKNAAEAELVKEVATTPVSDPATIKRLEAETGVAAAVNLANQTRYLQEDSGPCQGCTAPVTGTGGNDDDHGTDDQPEPPGAE